MQTIKANGQVVSTTPECDNIVVDPNAPRLSVEYARCRNSINADHATLRKSNMALADRLKRENKRKVIEFLNGKVSHKMEPKLDKNKQPIVGDDGKPVMMKKMLVTFPDNTVARL